MEPRAAPPPAGGAPRLETERLVLRLPCADDVPALAALLADAEVMRYIGRGETGGSVEALAQLASMQRAWELDGFGRFMVERRTDGTRLGRVGLLAWDPVSWRNGPRAELGPEAELELGWTLRREAWGHGYASEAAAAVHAWGFRTLAPARLISLIHPENVRSERVALRLGARLEGEVTTARGVTVGLWVHAPEPAAPS